MLSAAQDYDIGGMQLPYTVEAAANSFFAMASVSIGSGMLTTGNANLLMAHGTPAQQRMFAHAEFSGKWAGTMCLSEPQAGSSLSDLTTSATPQPDGTYRIKGSKSFISGGDHELRENIVHLVLARIPGAPPGVKGISLFTVPKFRVNADSSLGPRNDVTLSGLIGMLLIIQKTLPKIFRRNNGTLFKYITDGLILTVTKHLKKKCVGKFN